MSHDGGTVVDGRWFRGFSFQIYMIFGLVCTAILCSQLLVATSIHCQFHPMNKARVP